MIVSIVVFKRLLCSTSELFNKQEKESPQVSHPLMLAMQQVVLWIYIYP